MRRTIVTAAAVAVAGGAGVALAADPPEIRRAPVERPFLVGPPAIVHHAEPFGLHREIADDMAKELGLPADRVAEAMRKAIGAQFDRRRDEALKCFDDRKACAIAKLPPILPRRAIRPRSRP